ncbi:MAG: type III-A CRISPR-associated RAMP protein Csm3 [Bacteroidaceae bacterium]|uniref:type III-A CRISPR-associated RAMP protein Csm3 n=1 Tax=Fusobacterium varium TaxID=856 RepID=UPI00242CEB34|nr:type III-A CRISPR-associated RAMP protein Csm3 [Fusobacterium varium]MCF0171264.1 type III-A CRISPR-associated RAMP protein Csm3 [Fusobacterium varium]MCF0188760.1 type III-A CRISPR-associated RAMP protein Csm3 [Bacteroidaceae bacterium]
MRMKSIKNIEGTFELMTGTRIGGNSDIIEIGGNDSPIVRNPLTKELYIPGSSIKGKMRMLIEWLEGKIDESGKVHSCSEKECPVCRVFGRGAKTSGEAAIGTTRISVKDAFLTEKSKKELLKLRDRIGVDTEWKYENNINRLTSEATPRNSERIPAGVSFDFTISYKVFDFNDNGQIDEELFENVVIKALKVLSLEGIGGGVSRGNGQIKFTKLDVDGISYLEKINAFKI